MTRKQYSNAILAKNGGLHSRRALKSVQQAMTTHGLKKPILYQFIMSGKSTKGEYQATIKRLIEHIRTKCKAEYVGAYEVGTEKGGLHCHMFVIVETLHHFPGGDLLNVSAGNFIARRIKRTGMSITIEPPKNTMHGGAMFARMDTPAKLANCIEWATYILKVRSKDAVPGRETYFGSCHAANSRKREAQRQKHRDALAKSSKPAPAREEAPANGNKGDEMDAADKYMASKYETAVGKQMNLEEIRLFLLAEGIKRTPGQVLYDLNERFSFYGYAASHPAPRRLTYAEIDAQLGRDERTTNRTDRYASNPDRPYTLPPGQRPTGRDQTNTHRQGITT